MILKKEETQQTTNTQADLSNSCSYMLFRYSANLNPGISQFGTLGGLKLLWSSRQYNFNPYQ